MDEHMSEEQLTAAGAELRQREEILQCLFSGGSLPAGRPPGPAGGRRRAAACAHEDQTQEALT